MSAFLDLHRPGDPLLCPNPWDAGSARLLAALGFDALATTSNGFAATLGLPDAVPERDEVLANARAIVAATDLPVTADLEDGYDDPAETVRLAIDAGLAGGSIEDWTGVGSEFYDIETATARVAAAVDAAGDTFVITARADNLARGVDDLDDAIVRLQAYDAAGAHVLYAPFLQRIEDVRTVVASVTKPVNVLMRPNGPTVAELADAGVARITVGGSFAFAALGALIEAAQELRDQGTTGYSRLSLIGQQAAQRAFPDKP